jgi:xanthine dehydrogenase iron-sulfur cluster and FAD-binding subunit A
MGIVEATVAVRLQVNGSGHDLRLEPRMTLLDALRDVLCLTGTKKGCDRGECGAYELPELDVPVEPEWWCRPWRI